MEFEKSSFDFVAGRFNVAYNVSSDMLLRYPDEEIQRIMEDQVAQEMGHHALEKARVEKRNDPAIHTAEFIYTVHIFSREELKLLVSHIEELEASIRYLQSELNRRREY